MSLNARVYKDGEEWRLVVEGPWNELKELMAAQDRYPFRVASYGGSYPLAYGSVLFVPRKKYKREKHKRGAR